MTHKTVPNGRKVCTVKGCGRRASSKAGLCQTHQKYKREGRPLDPIRRKRRGRAGAVKYGGLSVTPRCADVLEKTAKRKGQARNALITDILESWFLRSKRRGRRS